MFFRPTSSVLWNMFTRKMWRRFPNGWRKASTQTSMTRTLVVRTKERFLHYRIQDEYLYWSVWDVSLSLSVCPCVSECPLTLAVQLEESCELIKVLRCGGAHLDFRTRDGITALHRAVLCRNSASLTVRIQCCLLRFKLTTGGQQLTSSPRVPVREKLHISLVKIELENGLAIK